MSRPARRPPSRRSPTSVIRLFTRARTASSTASSDSLDDDRHVPASYARLRHGTPSYHESWVQVRFPGRKRSDLRHCKVAGPFLKCSVSTRGGVMSGFTVLYGASVSSDEFGGFRIVIKPKDGERVVLLCDTKKDWFKWLDALEVAVKRSIKNEYEVQEQLRATFGFGKTCLAVDRENGLTVSVKTTGKSSLTPELIALARGESMSRLMLQDHPNLLDVLDVYESARHLYLVTEYVAGDSLDELVKRRRAVCEADAAVIILELLKALTHMHSMGAIHRLVLPHNVLVVPGATRKPVTTSPLRRMLVTRHYAIAGVKLCNFETTASNYVRDRNGVREAPVSMLKVIDGTSPLHLDHIAYLAPEVVTGEVGGCPQDLWSLGILMHYLLVGVTPFDSFYSSIPQAIEVISKSRRMPMPTLSGPMWNGISSGARHLCSNLLQADASLRPSAADAISHPWLHDASAHISF